jgi:hypothetical protein
MPPPYRARPSAFVVRKRDRNGRAYYLDRLHGGRTSRAAWLADLERRAYERAAYAAERARADAEERDRREAERRRRREDRHRPIGGGEGPPEGPTGGGGGGIGEGIDEDGVPEIYVDEFGNEWPAYEIEGEDETG